jgi:4a-hydroxytetrahydrobiopterin dehydratase
MTRPTLLEAAAVDAALVAAASPWVRDGDMLRFEHRFETFADAISFVDRVAVLADAADHHPDIDIRYTLVRLALTTHDQGGLTTLDVQLAAEVTATVTR